MLTQPDPNTGRDHHLDHNGFTSKTPVWQGAPPSHSSPVDQATVAAEVRATVDTAVDAAVDVTQFSHATDPSVDHPSVPVPMPMMRPEQCPLPGPAAPPMHGPAVAPMTAHAAAPHSRPPSVGTNRGAAPDT